MQVPYKVQGTGEPLLMIHGIMGDGSFFDEAAACLAPHYRVITYDRRGYGACEKPNDGTYTVAAQANDAAELLMQLCDEPAWVFGNSAGGLIALELALTHPHLVRGLVLLEPSLTLDADSRAAIDAWNAELNGYVAAGRIKRAFPAFARVVGDPSGGRSGQSMAELRRAMANLDTFMHGELNEVQHYGRTREELAQVALPVAVMVTERGADGLFGTTSLAGARILGWPVEMIAGYHNVARDNPQLLATRLVDVLGAWGAGA